jgi:hypothetical protein
MSDPNLESHRQNTIKIHRNAPFCKMIGESKMADIFLLCYISSNFHPVSTFKCFLDNHKSFKHFFSKKYFQVIGDFIFLHVAVFPFGTKYSHFYRRGCHQSKMASQNGFSIITSRVSNFFWFSLLRWICMKNSSRR